MSQLSESKILKARYLSSTCCMAFLSASTRHRSFLTLPNNLVNHREIEWQVSSHHRYMHEISAITFKHTTINSQSPPDLSEPTAWNSSVDLSLMNDLMVVIKVQTMLCFSYLLTYKCTAIIVHMDLSRLHMFQIRSSVSLSHQSNSIILASSSEC
jgi:hypothetical protein